MSYTGVNEGHRPLERVEYARLSMKRAPLSPQNN